MLLSEPLKCYLWSYGAKNHIITIRKMEFLFFCWLCWNLYRGRLLKESKGFQQTEVKQYFISFDFSWFYFIFIFFSKNIKPKKKTTKKFFFLQLLPNMPERILLTTMCVFVKALLNREFFFWNVFNLVSTL